MGTAFSRVSHSLSCELSTGLAGSLFTMAFSAGCDCAAQPAASNEQQVRNCIVSRKNTEGNKSGIPFESLFEFLRPESLLFHRDGGSEAHGRHNLAHTDHVLPEL